MKKILSFIIAAASIAAVSCSKIDAPEQQKPFWNATVRLVPSSDTRTSLDESAHLSWAEGDMVSYWTSADGVNFGESVSAGVVNGEFTATIPTGHSHIKVVYPSVADGSEYAVPTVKKYQNHPSAGSFDGHYLPMTAEKDDVVEGAESLVLRYTVLGSVLRFKVTGSGVLKAVKAGDYQADYLNTAELSETPVEAFVVIPTGTVIYTPKAFVISTTIGSYIEYTRSQPKESTFSAKAYDIAMSLNDDTKYTKDNGWKKASDIGLSVAWADMNYGSSRPGLYTMLEWTNSNDWGSGWRLPTEAEMQELTSLSAASKAMGALNGVNGCFVSNNGASIFFPIGGYLNAYYDDIRGTDTGYYWYDSYAGTAKRWGDPFDKHSFMSFSNEANFSTGGAAFDMDERAIRLVRPLD